MARQLTVIEDPEAYERGKQNRIRANAFRGRQKRFEAAYPGLWQRVMAADSRLLPGWVRESLLQWGGLTDKQAAFAIRALDEAVDRAWEQALAEQQRRETQQPWAAGRQLVTGTVVSCRWVDNDFGSSLKGLLATADGHKVWLTIPRGVDGTADEIRGRQLTVKVTIQPQSDPGFAFGSRPVLVRGPEAP